MSEQHSSAQHSLNQSSSAQIFIILVCVYLSRSCFRRGLFWEEHSCGFSITCDLDTDHEEETQTPKSRKNESTGWKHWCCHQLNNSSVCFLVCCCSIYYEVSCCLHRSVLHNCPVRCCLMSPSDKRDSFWHLWSKTSLIVSIWKSWFVV